jgi:serine/threonine protein kinase
MFDNTLPAVLIMIGTKLAHFEITSHLGTGGMGEVYQATDAKLGRSVAIKLLPEALTHDTDRAARFEREARLLASLNHPHIATIHGIEESGGRKFLVMELALGETLAERISRGPIPIDEALPIAVQIAEALEAAHEKGIIHRDLKPANIKVTPQGDVKVLDFGLAKAFAEHSAETNPSNSPTVSMAATNAGVILGTAAYMSPEQARGKSVDARTDIWAFGCVLYEMLTGRKVFEGETASDSIAKILAGQPDWTLLPAGTPSAIRTLLAAALNKDPRQRLQHIRDARLFLQSPADEPMKQRVVSRRGRGWVVTVLLTLGFLSALIPGTLYFLRAPEDDHVTRFVVNAPEGTSLSTLAGESAISPDGRKLVFLAYSNTGQSKLWVQSFDDVLPRALAGTESSDNPFWSPDSQRIAFVAQGNLKKVSASGGSPETISRGASQISGIWSAEDEIIFGSSGLLYRVSAKGGNGTPATVLDKLRGDVWHFPVSWLPDNRHFLYIAFGLTNGATPGALISGALDSKDTRLVSRDVTMGVYVKPGYYLSLRDGAIMAQEFDPSSLQFKGDASRLVDQASYFSVSTTGVLEYTPLIAGFGFQLFSFDRQGRKTALKDIAPDNYRVIELSPDGKQLALERYFQDIWLHDRERGVTNKTTFPASFGPRWSSDSSYLAFSTNTGIYRKRSTGGEQELLLNQTGTLVSDWSKDGQKILYSIIGKQTDLWIASFDGKEWKAKPLVQTDADERNGRFSPDGRWVAYESNESGQYEVYVRPSSDSSEGTVISKSGGVQPRWKGDGKELFFLSLEGKLMTVTIDALSNTIEPGIPHVLFDAGAPAIGSYGAPSSSYTVTPDGQRFYVAVPAQTSPVGPNRIHVILNWPALLKKQK